MVPAKFGLRSPWFNCSPENVPALSPRASVRATMAAVVSHPTKASQMSAAPGPNVPTLLSTFLQSVVESVPEEMSRSDSQPMLTARMRKAMLGRDERKPFCKKILNSY